MRRKSVIVRLKNVMGNARGTRVNVNMALLQYFIRVLDFWLIVECCKYAMEQCARNKLWCYIEKQRVRKQGAK